MSGFDMEWATKHQRKTGREVKVQAGAAIDSAVAAAVDAAACQGVGFYRQAMEDPFAEAAPTAAPEQIVLVLPYPLSGNRVKGERVIPAAHGKPAFTHHFLTKEAEAYKAEVQKRALLQRVTKPYLGRVFVGIQLYPQRPLDWEKRASKDPMNWADTVRCIDLSDNARKFLMDCLQGIAFVNDNQIWKDEGEKMEPDALGARVVVTVRPIVRVDPRGSLL
jgi:crossover junction endodeoxyribonuclease RusA